MKQQILDFCLSKGFLVDNDVLDMFNETTDLDSAKLIIEKINLYTNQNFLSKRLFENNKDQVNKLFLSLPQDKQEGLEQLKVKLGLTNEITKSPTKTKEPGRVQVLSEYYEAKQTPVNEKLAVKNFVNYFKSRFNTMSGILQDHAELDSLISIDKLDTNRQGISIIGIVCDKKATKNGNLMLEVEDNTGRIKVLINSNKEDAFKKGEEICLDSVLGFKGAGSKDIFFANDVVFPEAMLPERKRSNHEEYALFIGDLHFGSKLFLKKGFNKFIDYLNGKVKDTPEVNNIKYLFLVGDIITGVGNYPNQEGDLEIMDLEDQYVGLAELLGKIRKDIKIIISPGNHDGVRIMEPQPVFDEKFAWALYEMDNVIITENPANVSIGAREGFGGLNVLTYHGFSYPYYANNINYLVLKNAMNCPEEIMKYLLRQRHLAPTHQSTQYYPHSVDPLLIREVPDIFVSAHTHKCGITYYNNILVISTACWEAMTPYQEKFGNKPDHCKVPMLNLKTRAVKILDFEDIEESQMRH